jgi:predicted SnoaL-like aldol condensation-catalyzing enzyme
LVLEAFDTLFNKRDYKAAERYWSSNYIQHSAHIPPGRDGLFNLIRSTPATLKYEPGVILADKDYVIVHGRFSGTGRVRNWIAADVVRVADGVLAEHWDVLQDEATEAESQSGRPMFGSSFPAETQICRGKETNMADQTSPKTYRRVVTGYSSGKSVVLSDTHLSTYAFKTIPGFRHTYVWTTDGTAEVDPAKVDTALPKSALPLAGGSLVQIVTFPPAASRTLNALDPKAIAQEYLTRLPGLADTFERDGSQMHATPTIDYALLLDGELWLELDDGKTVHLSAGDIVVQQATRHGWRNKSDRPATIAFFMLGSHR